MNNPLVSIILPTHNGSKYIRKSLESCINQTYRNIEIIVINDCSSDNTQNIVEEFISLDSRIRIINNKYNLKLPSSLNVGFENAKGEFFTWTSDDNFYAKNAIETMQNFLMQNNNLDLVYCNYKIINEKDEIISDKIFHDVNESMVKWLGCGACFLYKRELHKKLNGYDPSAFLIEDYDFFIRGLLFTQYGYIKRTDLYFYRMHAESLTSLYGHYNIDLMKIVVERKLPDLIKICSTNDKILWYRKFAIYYGVTKNNSKRMKKYLENLYGLSKSQALISVFYIIFRKAFFGIVVSVNALISLMGSIFFFRKADF